MITRLSDIAQVCKLDVSTVSRALRNDPRVYESTRKRIRKIAAKMNYAPNLAARNLAAGTTKTLWLLVPDLNNPMQQEPAQYLSERLSHDGYDLMIVLYHGESDSFRRLLMQLTQHVTDGAFIIPDGIAYDAKEYTYLKKHKYPLVFIDRSVELKGGITVTTDNATAAAELVERCLQAGADKFAIIYEKDNSAGYERIQGAKKVLSRKKIPYEIFNKVKKADSSFLKGGRTAILSSSSGVAYAFFEHNRQRFTVNAPVAGVFDRWIEPAEDFTGIHVCYQNFRGIAEKAAEVMLATLKGEKPESGFYYIPALNFQTLKEQ
jgi:DNA-binding LacI/PurR family transcriptional regulator